MTVPVGLNVWSRLVEATFPYFDQTVGPFDSLWLPDHVQYNGHPVAEGWTLLAWALARYPDKKAGHEVLCNSFRNPAHTAKMLATNERAAKWAERPTVTGTSTKDIRNGRDIRDESDMPGGHAPLRVASKRWRARSSGGH